MIRRDVLQSIGWGTSITEDFELTLKLYEAGYKVIYTPYIQAPAEAVGTLKRLIRQRMRWAEGHSYNVKRMCRRLLFGQWTEEGASAIRPNSEFRVHNSELVQSSESIPTIQHSQFNSEFYTLNSTLKKKTWSWLTGS